MGLAEADKPLYEIKANLFKGLAHPLRIRILELLSKCPEASVADLLQEMDLEASHLSQHLSVLRRHQLVISERRGSHVYYRLASPLSRNDKVVQQGHWRDMTWPIPKLLQHISRHIALQPGDLLSLSTAQLQQAAKLPQASETAPTAGAW